MRKENDMQIETFEIEERDNVMPELEAEAITLIDKLGLKGQRELVVKPESTDTETRIPYPEMTKRERAVYDALFPAKTEAKNYSAGIIPIRVLQVIAYAIELFDAIRVWHKPVTDPDPILVGEKGDKKYLLARWGSALQPFEMLVEEAREVLTQRFRASLNECKVECDAALAKVDALVQKKLEGDWVYVAGPTF